MKRYPAKLLMAILLLCINNSNAQMRKAPSREQAVKSEQENGLQLAERFKGASLVKLLEERILPQQPEEGVRSYAVRAGDTQKLIAASLNLSLQDLYAANPGVNWTKLTVGQLITVPSALAILGKSNRPNETFISTLADALIEAKNRELPGFIAKSTVEQRVVLLTTVEQRLMQAQTQFGKCNADAESFIRQGKENEASDCRKLAVSIQTYQGVLKAIQEMLSQS